jgi:hypothetical protein
MTKTKTKKLLKERGAAYGNAWQTTGHVIKPVIHLIAGLVEMAPEIYLPWMMILNKLVRALYAPDHADNWRDIIGYATLVYESLEHKTEE